MAYCPRCGVKIEDRLDRCPLCDTPIPVEARDADARPGEYPDDVIPPTPMYRRLTMAQKRSLFRGLIGFLAVFPVALTVLLDVRGAGGVTWSWYVATPIFGAAAIAWVWYRFGGYLIRAVTATLVTLALVYVLLRLPGAGYSLLRVLTTSRVLPFLLAVFLAVEAFLLFATRRRRTVTTLLASAGLDLAILVLALDALITGGKPLQTWSLITGAVLVAVTVYSVYLSRVRRRGLNVVGFFFLELTVLLGVLDVVIAGRIGGSGVTALVFVPIAIVLYTLHIVLFNDTDWRKALHL